MAVRYTFGPYELDATRRLLTRGADPVTMTARTFDVLLALIERHGRTVEKDELLGIVWPDTIVEESNISQQIFTIRRLLGHSEEHPYVATVSRRGYQFVAPVDVHDGAPATAPVSAAPMRGPIRLAVPIAPAAPLAPGVTGALAISPDGSCLVFIAAAGESTQLFLRPIDRFETTPIPGTEGALHPFFSPDGRSVGFQSGRRLRIASLDGGPPLSLCDVADLRGATWGGGGDIVFAPGPTAGLWRVSATGGAAMPLTVVDVDAGERTHRWPHVTPDGAAVVFTIGYAGAASFDEASLAVARLSGEPHRVILRHATDGRCVNRSLLWGRGGSLMEAPFDPTALEIAGSARHVQTGVAMAATGVAHFACSANGVLAHVPGEAQTLKRTLVRVGRDGRIDARHARGEALEEPRVSPDGRGVLVSLRGRSSDLWRFDCARGTLERLTFEGENFAGIWGPDAGAITFSSSHGGGSSDIHSARSGAGEPPELLVASEFDKAGSCWSPDGSLLLFVEYHPDTGADIWVLDRAARRATSFVRTRFNEYSPVFSPDGRLVAFTTDETGRPEIQVSPFAEPAARRQVSTDGGSEPVWSRDGRELYYRSGDRLMRVDMSRGPVDPGVPMTMFEGRFVSGTVTLANYDVAADGQSFFMVQEDVTPAPTAVCVTIGWEGGH
jgi:Tol biopolymer transport system component